MKLRLLASLLIVCLGPVLAHADDPVHKELEASTAQLPKIGLTPQFLHRFLIAEIAGHRGQMGLAVGTYGDLARETRDPRVAKRAADIALFARQYDAALNAARIWADADPESQPARQMLANLLAASGRGEELSIHIAKMLATAGPDLGPALLGLNRVFARSADKAVARKLIDEVTAPYLGLAEAHFARAIAAYETKDVAGSRQAIERALELRPSWEQAALVRAQVVGRGPEMLAGLKAFVAANPKAGDARLAYARALVGDKQYEDARREFNQLLEDNPNNSDVIYAVAVLSLQLNEPSLAENHLKRLVELGYAESDSARLYLGQIAEDRKSLDEAIRWYSEVTVGDQYLAAQVRMANLLAKSDRFDEARRGLQEAHAAGPREKAQLVLAEAQLLRDAGRFGDAYGVLEAGLVNQPSHPDMLYEAALAAEKVGHSEVLERNLRLLIQIKPDYAHAYNALGYSFVERGERIDEAQQLIDKALQLSPDDPYILDSKGWLLFRKGESGAALDVLKKALTLKPDPEIAAHYGEVLWALGRRDEALKTWRDAFQVSPNNEALAATIKRFTP